MLHSQTVGCGIGQDERTARQKRPLHVQEVHISILEFAIFKSNISAEKGAASAHTLRLAALTATPKRQVGLPSTYQGAGCAQAPENLFARCFVFL